MKLHLFKISVFVVGFILFFVSCDDDDYTFLSEQITVVNDTGSPLTIALMDQETAALFDPAPFITLKKNASDLLNEGDIMLFLRDNVEGKLDSDETLFVQLFSASPDFLRNNSEIPPVSKDEIVLFYTGSVIVEPSELAKNDGVINVNIN